MNDLADDSAFALGMPTLLETYKHQCVLLEAELAEGRRDLRAARKRIAVLVTLADELAHQRDGLRAELARARGAR